MARSTARKTDEPASAGDPLTQDAIGARVRVRATYTPKGKGETTRNFDCDIPQGRMSELGGDMEIFLLYDLVFEQVSQTSEIMMSNARILEKLS